MRICESFKSIQGEGLMMGMPTFFVRTVGCNLSCAWCDTRYSMVGGKDMSLEEIMDSIGECGHVCVTGGEPMLQPEMPELLKMLVAAGKQVLSRSAILEPTLTRDLDFDSTFDSAML